MKIKYTQGIKEINVHYTSKGNIYVPVGYILISIFDLDLAVTLQFRIVHNVIHIFSYGLNLRRTLGTCQQI